jgi:hypothetical protein
MYLEGVWSHDGVGTTVVADLILDHRSRDTKARNEIRVLSRHSKARDVCTRVIQVTKGYELWMRSAWSTNELMWRSLGSPELICCDRLSSPVRGVSRGD